MTSGPFTRCLITVWCRGACPAWSLRDRAPSHVGGRPSPIVSTFLSVSSTKWTAHNAPSLDSHRVWSATRETRGYFHHLNLCRGFLIGRLSSRNEVSWGDKWERWLFKFLSVVTVSDMQRHKTSYLFSEEGKVMLVETHTHTHSLTLPKIHKAVDGWRVGPRWHWFHE